DGGCAIAANIATLTMAPSAAVQGTTAQGQTTTAQLQAAAPITICDVGLGIEKYWDYEAVAGGPQMQAHVNVANGNLVLDQTDTTPVQAHGHLTYGLRRVYNSEATPALVFPGSLGAGWQFAVDAGDGTAGDGLVPQGLFSPSLQSVSQPLSIALIDQDGTRHIFSPRALPAAATAALDGTPVGTLAPMILQP